MQERTMHRIHTYQKIDGVVTERIGYTRYGRRGGERHPHIRGGGTNDSERIISHRPLTPHPQTRGDTPCLRSFRWPTLHWAGSTPTAGHHPCAATPNLLFVGDLDNPAGQCCAFNRHHYTPSTARDFDLHVCFQTNSGDHSATTPTFCQ